MLKKAFSTTFDEIVDEMKKLDDDDLPSYHASLSRRGSDYFSKIVFGDFAKEYLGAPESKREELRDELNRKGACINETDDLLKELLFAISRYKRKAYPFEAYMKLREEFKKDIPNLDEMFPME